MSAPIVELKGVCFTHNRQTALQDVNLTIWPRDFIGVIGPNGGGKTTLLKLILGLFTQDSGTVRVMGSTANKASSTIGYVPQNVHINNQFPITALDVVLMGKLNRRTKFRLNTKENRTQALEMLERLNVLSIAHQRIGKLSGGERQRVLIARALMTQPKLLLLDEPTASIDTKGQTEFYNLLTQLNKEVAILIVSHDLLAISNYVKSVACVNKGLHYHPKEEITGDMLETMYSCSVEDVCRVQILAGLPLKIKAQEGDNGDS